MHTSLQIIHTMYTGLLSPPLQLQGLPLPNISAIHLTWSPPPSLNLTGIEPDINHYEITVFNNKTGARENFSSLATEFTYYIQEVDHYVDTCQELVFSVLAVNVVGKGKSSIISVALNSGTYCNIENIITVTVTRIKVFFVIIHILLSSFR